MCSKVVTGSPAQIFGFVFAIFSLYFCPIDKNNRYAIMPISTIAPSGIPDTAGLAPLAIT